MDFFLPGVSTLEYHQPNRREDREHARLRRRLNDEVHAAATRAWDDLPSAARHALSRRAKFTFSALCDLVDAQTQERAFGRMRVLRHDSRHALMVRMRPADMGVVPYTDDQLASYETMVEIVQRTVHRYINNVVHRDKVFHDADETKRDVRAGQDDERILRRFLHVSQRAYWPPEAIVYALRFVEEAGGAVHARLRALHPPTAGIFSAHAPPR